MGSSTPAASPARSPRPATVQVQEPDFPPVKTETRRKRRNMAVSSGVERSAKARDSASGSDSDSDSDQQSAPTTPVRGGADGSPRRPSPTRRSPSPTNRTQAGSPRLPESPPRVQRVSDHRRGFLLRRPPLLSPCCSSVPLQGFSRAVSAMIEPTHFHARHHHTLHQVPMAEATVSPSGAPQRIPSQQAIRAPGSEVQFSIPEARRSPRGTFSSPRHQPVTCRRPTVYIHAWPYLSMPKT